VGEKREGKGGGKGREDPTKFWKNIDALVPGWSRVSLWEQV